MKVLLATDKPFASQAVQKIQNIVETAGHTLEKLEKYSDKTQLLDAVKDANAVIIRSDIIDEEVINSAPQLKVIIRAGSGFDNVDLATATARGICVMNTPGQNANAVAELIFGMLIYQQRNRFDGSIGRELTGKRLGLFAFGHVAKMAAKIARGFDMPVYSYSPIMTDDDLRKQGEYGVSHANSAKELFENSDIVSLHMPLLPDTLRCVNRELLSLLPENGIVVNSARKEVVNEDDMIRIMEERPQFQYITDIKADRHDEFTAKFPTRYFATSKKAGAQTSEANINAGLAAAQQAVDFFEKGDERYRVN